MSFEDYPVSYPTYHFTGDLPFGAAGARAIRRCRGDETAFGEGTDVDAAGRRDAKGNPDAITDARLRVDNAKVARGERGPVW